MTISDDRQAYIAYFMRHGESVKNLNDKFGGDGAPLTDLGKRQVEEAIRYIERRYPTITNVVAAPNPQTVASAQAIANRLKLPFEINSGLTGAQMGDLAGLTMEQIRTRSPAGFERLEAWRAGEIEAWQLKLPGMEEPTEFWERMNKVCEDLPRPSPLVVATRSILVYAINKSNGRHPAPGGAYKHCPVHHCQVVSLSIA